MYKVFSIYYQKVRHISILFAENKELQGASQYGNGWLAKLVETNCPIEYLANQLEKNNNKKHNIVFL